MGTAQGRPVSGAWGDSGSPVPVDDSPRQRQRAQLWGRQASEGWGRGLPIRGENAGLGPGAGGDNGDQDARSPAPCATPNPGHAAGVHAARSTSASAGRKGTLAVRFISTLSMERSFREALNVTCSETPLYPVLPSLKVPTATLQNTSLCATNISVKHYRFRS